MNSKPKKMRTLGAHEAVYEQIESVYKHATVIKGVVESAKVINVDSENVKFIRTGITAIYPQIETLREWSENNYLLERDTLNVQERQQVVSLCTAINNEMKSLYRTYTACTNDRNDNSFSSVRYVIDDFRSVFSSLSRSVSFVNSVDSYV